MNRRERRQIEKRMGIISSRKKLSRMDKFAMMRENIESGKKIEEEMKETRRIQDNDKKDKIHSQNVSSKATELMIKEGLSYIDALEKAKEQVK
ncbi:MAG: hypothetical protein ACOC1K_02285 [Nanoarchaeota archaeon]